MGSMDRIELGKFSFNKKVFNLSLNGTGWIVIERLGDEWKVDYDVDVRTLPKYLAACVTEARIRNKKLSHTSCPSAKYAKPPVGPAPDTSGHYLGDHRYDDKNLRLYIKDSPDGKILILRDQTGKTLQYVNMNVDIKMVPDYVADCVVQAQLRMNRIIPMDVKTKTTEKKKSNQFQCRLDQNDNTIFMTIQAQDECLRNNVLFAASNGFTIDSCNQPQLTKDRIYIRGSLKERDLIQVYRRFMKDSEAYIYLRNVESALQEWVVAGCPTKKCECLHCQSMTPDGKKESEKVSDQFNKTKVYNFNDKLICNLWKTEDTGISMRIIEMDERFRATDGNCAKHFVKGKVTVSSRFQPQLSETMDSEIKVWLRGCDKTNDGLTSVVHFLSLFQRDNAFNEIIKALEEWSVGWSGFQEIKSTNCLPDDLSDLIKVGDEVSIINPPLGDLLKQAIECTGNVGEVIRVDRKEAVVRMAACDFTISKSRLKVRSTKSERDQALREIQKVMTPSSSKFSNASVLRLAASLIDDGTISDAEVGKYIDRPGLRKALIHKAGRKNKNSAMVDKIIAGV